MARKHSDLRFKIPRAVVMWEPLTFWHRFKSGRIEAGPRHELLAIGDQGLEFRCESPPEKGTKLLLNLIVPEEVYPFVLEGDVLGDKPYRGSEAERRVGIRFSKTPKDFPQLIKQFGQVVL